MAISLGIGTRDLAYRVVSVSSRDQSLLGPDQLFSIILLKITLNTWLVRRSPFREKLVGNVSPHFDFYQIVSRKNNTPGAPLLWVVGMVHDPSLVLPPERQPRAVDTS